MYHKYAPTYHKYTSTYKEVPSFQIAIKWTVAGWKVIGTTLHESQQRIWANNLSRSNITSTTQPNAQPKPTTFVLARTLLLPFEKENAQV